MSDFKNFALHQLSTRQRAPSPQFELARFLWLVLYDWFRFVSDGIVGASVASLFATMDNGHLYNKAACYLNLYGLQ